MKTMRFAFLTVAALAVAVGTSPCWAGGGTTATGCCDAGCGTSGCAGQRCCRCGAACAEPVCCLVKSTKEVTVTCYGMKCKEICVPGCGSDCATTECLTCGDTEEGCSASRVFCGIVKAFYGTGKPGCAKVRCVKELVKYEMTKTVPAYKYEVQYRCPSCAQQCLNGGCCGTGCGSDGGCCDGGCCDGGCADETCGETAAPEKAAAP